MASDKQWYETEEEAKHALRAMATAEPAATAKLVKAIEQARADLAAAPVGPAALKSAPSEPGSSRAGTRARWAEVAHMKRCAWAETSEMLKKRSAIAKRLERLEQKRDDADTYSQFYDKIATVAGPEIAQGLRVIQLLLRAAADRLVLLVELASDGRAVYAIRDGGVPTSIIGSSPLFCRGAILFTTFSPMTPPHSDGSDVDRKLIASQTIAVGHSDELCARCVMCPIATPEHAADIARVLASFVATPQTSARAYFEGTAISRDACLLCAEPCAPDSPICPACSHSSSPAAALTSIFAPLSALQRPPHSSPSPPPPDIRVTRRTVVTIRM